jgi:hypothetical protein
LVTPLQKARKKAQQIAKREREKKRRLVRAAKRAAKAAPKNAMLVWTDIVRENDGDCCAVCGIGVVKKTNKDGTPKLNKRGKPILISLQCHHLLPRERYPQFKLVPINGILLCTQHHKWSRYSFHRNPIWATLWLRRNRPHQYLWCKQNMGHDPSETR